jgi:hypothetical protein
MNMQVLAAKGLAVAFCLIISKYGDAALERQSYSMNGWL